MDLKSLLSDAFREIDKSGALLSSNASLSASPRGSPTHAEGTTKGMGEGMTQRGSPAHLDAATMAERSIAVGSTTTFAEGVEEEEESEASSDELLGLGELQHLEGEVAREGEMVDDQWYHLDAAADVSVPLTMAPSVLTALGLEQILLEARGAGLYSPSRRARFQAGAQAAVAAEAKLEEVLAEMRACVRKWESRKASFRRCEVLMQIAKRLMLSVAGDAATARRGLSRSQFLDFHLGLAREGFFGGPIAGVVSLSQLPYCYQPPAYVRHIRHVDAMGWSRRVSVGSDEGDWPMDDDGSEAEGATGAAQGDGDGAPVGTAAGRRFVPIEEGLVVWKALQQSGALQGELLPLDSFVELLFELADAHVTGAHRQEVERCAAASAPVAQSDATPPLRQLRSGSCAYAKLQEYATFLARVHCTLTVPASVDLLSAPPPPIKLSCPSEARCLRHRWPPPGAHAAEVARRIKLLQYAVCEQQEAEVLSKPVVRRAFHALRRTCGARQDHAWEHDKMTYTQLDHAVHTMAGQGFADLVFRHAVLARATRQEDDGRARHEAEWLDDDQVLCLLRELDVDDDGFVSLHDFCKVLLSVAAAPNDRA